MSSVYQGLVSRRRRQLVGADDSSNTQGTAASPVQNAAQSLLGMSNPCDLSTNCAAVQAFQSAWNAAGQGATLTVDGYYGPDTQAAAAQILGPNAPAACAANAYTGSCSGGGGGSAPAPSGGGAITPSPMQASALGGKLWWIIGAVAVAVLGALGYRYEAHGGR